MENVDWTATYQIDNTAESPLLHYFAGEELYKLFKNTPPPHTRDKHNYDVAIMAIIARVDPCSTPTISDSDYAKQREEEMIYVIYVCLKELASSWVEDNQSNEVRVQIIQECRCSMVLHLISHQLGVQLADILILARSHNVSNSRSEKIKIGVAKGIAEPSPPRGIRFEETAGIIKDVVHDT
ncbi:hypothetical protein NDU88_006217 [Pleurodeles waltl]|uniref:Uncharacterized protein n=1 Tax=Pleurodeles waltl TaxID=8319 RepID=A0AAV7NTI7_PLEWA|nr:hypothetical protein NDU88_006217 [Pleurodeles waltl]